MSLEHFHPAAVHFPIALFVTALGFDVACLAFRRQVWLDRAAVALYGLGAVGAGIAAVTGKLAASHLSESPGLSPEAAHLVGEHGDWAFFTVVLFVIVWALRFDVFWRDRQSLELSLHRKRMLSLVVAAAAFGVLFVTASRGAAMVYQHGLGVLGHPSNQPF